MPREDDYTPARKPLSISEYRAVGGLIGFACGTLLGLGAVTTITNLEYAHQAPSELITYQETTPLDRLGILAGSILALTVAGNAKGREYWDTRQNRQL